MLYAVVRMFAVVKFLPTEPDDDEQVEAVPLGWLLLGKPDVTGPLSGMVTLLLGQSKIKLQVDLSGVPTGQK